MMFNTWYEHLLVCQSLLKEQRRPPTGGPREGLEESLGGGVSMPSFPGVGPLEPLLFNFPLPGETMDTTWNGITPIGVFPVGASRLWGARKGRFDRA